jgi:hypothetical protein
MTYSNGVQELAGRLHRALTTQKRPSSGEDITVLDDAKKEPWMTEVIMAVHNSDVVGDVLPDDAVYAFIDELAGLVADDHDIDESYEADIYNATLDKWMSSFPLAQSYFDDAVGEYGYPKDGYYAAVQLAQHMAARAVGEVLVSALEGWVKSEAQEMPCFSCGDSHPKEQMFGDDYTGDLQDFYCLGCAEVLLGDGTFSGDVEMAIMDARDKRDAAQAE